MPIWPSEWYNVGQTARGVIDLAGMIESACEYDRAYFWDHEPTVGEYEAAQRELADTMIQEVREPIIAWRLWPQWFSERQDETWILSLRARYFVGPPVTGVDSGGAVKTSEKG